MTTRHYRSEDGITGYDDGDLLINDTTGERSMVVRDGRGLVLQPAPTKTRTITLTDRPPVKIREDEWPLIADAKWWDSEYDFQANRTASVRVREHEDGRRIVYGVSSSQWQGESDAKAGILIAAVDGKPDTDATIRAIHDVTDRIGHPALAAECIADLPAVEL